MEQKLTFEEVIRRLFDETKEINVVATNWINDGHVDVALRSGDAYFEIPYHDPIIDGYVFMICGDFKACAERAQYDLGLLTDAEIESDYYIYLRAQTMVGDTCFTINLGMYSIKKAEKITEKKCWDTAYKLTIKRKG